MDTIWHGIEVCLFRRGVLAQTPWRRSNALDSLGMGGPCPLPSLSCSMDASPQSANVLISERANSLNQALFQFSVGWWANSSPTVSQITGPPNFPIGCDTTGIPGSV